MTNVKKINLTREEKFIDLGELGVFKVNDSKNTVLRVMELWENEDDKLSEIDKLNKTLITVLGKKEFNKINEADISFDNYQEICITVMDLITNQDVENLKNKVQTP